MVTHLVSGGLVNSTTKPTLYSVRVPAGSPSCGRHVTVYVHDINQPSLPAPFHSVFVSVSVSMPLSTAFHSMKFSRQLPAFSLRCSGLISAFLVLSTMSLYESLLQP